MELILVQDNGLGCDNSGRYYSVSKKMSHGTLGKSVYVHVIPTEMPTHYLHIINAYVCV